MSEQGVDYVAEIAAQYAPRDTAIEAAHAAYESYQNALKVRIPFAQRRGMDDASGEAQMSYHLASERLLAAYDAALAALDEMERAANGRPTKADEDADHERRASDGELSD